MYRTLRDAGYSPDRAHKAVVENKFPDEEGGETIREKKIDIEEKRVDAASKRADVAKEKADQSLTTNQNTLRDRILNKMANGEDLTPGEQKVYDDVFKKYGTRPAKTEIPKVEKPKESAVPAAAKKEMSTPTEEEYVKMLDPNGKKVKVHKDDVERAIKKGWKRR